MLKPREDISPKDDMRILKIAIQSSNKKLTGTNYKFITIKEAMVFIGYPLDYTIDIKG